MAKRYDNVPWTAVVDAPDGVLPDPPCGFKRQEWQVLGETTHYRFIPECGNWELPEDEE